MSDPRHSDNPYERITINDILNTHNADQSIEATVEFGVFLRRYYRSLTGQDSGTPGIPPVYAATIIAQYQGVLLAQRTGTEPPVVVMPVSADGFEFLSDGYPSDLEGDSE